MIDGIDEGTCPMRETEERLKEGKEIAAWE
jgi:hypothetical protein